MAEAPFIPPEFEPPSGLTEPRFVLEPLTPEHNGRDYAAWTSSMEHIHATPGFTESRWPHEMTLAENRADLERHQRDFAGRTGFTYTVLDPDDRDVVGCLYIYPRKDGPGAHVTSWVRSDRAELDEPLADAVAAWLKADWPFERVLYLGRPTRST
jgi:hypothetical protein